MDDSIGRMDVGAPADDEDAFPFGNHSVRREEFAAWLAADAGPHGSNGRPDINGLPVSIQSTRLALERDRPVEIARPHDGISAVRRSSRPLAMARYAGQKKGSAFIFTVPNSIKRA